MNTTTSPETSETGRAAVRTCVGCHGRLSGVASAADVHVRVVVGPRDAEGQGEVAVDLAGTAFGRGAHVHARPSCLKEACRTGFSRSFRRKVDASAHDLAQQIVRGSKLRIRGLLLGARRGGLLAFGEEAREAVGSGRATLVLIAADAGASATKGPLLSAIEAGQAVAFGTKEELGTLFGREEVAVVAILHPGVAAAIHCARAASDAVSSLAEG